MAIDEKKHIEDLEELKKYRQLGTVEELAKRIPEEKVLKFYYCESLDKYLVGIRCGTMYYAELTENHCLCMIMSRYLPWGKHIVDETTLWKEHTYPSEPKEIPFDEWLRGYINQQPKLDVPDTKVGMMWIPYDDEHEEPPMPDYYRVTVKGNIWRNNKFVFGKYTDIYYWDGTMFTDSIDDNGAVIAWLPNPEPYDEDR